MGQAGTAAGAAVRKPAVRIVITNQYEEVLLQKRDADVLLYPRRWCTFGAEVRGYLQHRSVEVAGANIIEDELDWWPSDAPGDLHVVAGCPDDGWEYKDEAGEWAIHYLHWPIYRGHISRFRLQQGSGMAWFGRGELLDIAPDMIMKDDVAISAVMGWRI